MADPDREHERIEREEQRDRDGDAREVPARRFGARHANTTSAGSSATPAERVSSARPGSDAGPPEPPSLGEQERRDREQQEERLAVDRTEEERRRGDGEEQHRAPGAPSSPSRIGREPVEERERGGARGERDDHARRARK